MNINDFYVGQSYKLTRSFSESDVKMFSEVSLDTNPVYLNDEYAKSTIFKRKIVHGFLTSSLFSAIIGNYLPGNGSIYMNQNLSFKKPVYHNQSITAIVTVSGINKEKSIIDLSTQCFDDKGVLLIDGTARVKLI